MSPNYKLLNASLSEVRAAIPSHLFVRKTSKSLGYLVRDLAQAIVLFFVTSLLEERLAGGTLHVTLKQSLHTALITFYWWFQGLTFTGLWVIGHECGHGSFSPFPCLNDTIGFIVHTMMWTPYFSWKISHHRHHANHGSMERDEVYVPKTRQDLGIPALSEHKNIDYSEYISDTPLYNLLNLVLQQLSAFPAYLLYNVSGQKTYPRWTGHWNPRCVLFRDSHFLGVMISNAAIIAMLSITYFAIQVYGFAAVFKYYLVPWLAVSHWFVMITYLHHTTPEVPHFKERSWTFVRGAAATVDRDFLGWQGRYFLHDVAHFHVIHHFFPKMPWYNGEEATTHLRRILGRHYLSSKEPIFQALWRSYNDCQFVEDDDGEILFYKDQKGSYRNSFWKNNHMNDRDHLSY